MSSLVQSGGIRDWTIYNWCYTCNIIIMNCFLKKFYSKHVSLYDKGHYIQHDMLIKLLEMTSTSSNVKRRHWHKMSVSFHASLINLQLRHCGHLGIKFIRKVCSIRIWENVIFENFVTKVPFRLTLLILKRFKPFTLQSGYFGLKTIRPIVNSVASSERTTANFHPCLSKI